MSDRRYDVVLLGATGFTGRLTARHLAERLASQDRPWALAGRNLAKLQALREQLPGSPAVELADVGDPPSLAALAARTRVLATTVGPYARYGEAVVAACVESGTHYADITGEPGFVSLVRDRYDEPARRQGLRLVSCCGFDSVPHDLGVRFTVAQLPDDRPVAVRGYVRAKARFSGGTANSAIDAIASRQLPRAERTANDALRPTALLPARLHRVPDLNAWALPLPTIDPAIVLRSAQALPGYGSRFEYGHYLRLEHLPAAVAGTLGIVAAAGLAALPPTRALLRRVLPAPGEGPRADVRARSWFDVTFLGEAGTARVVTRVAGGDPGYDETARMLGEAALALAFDDLPDASGALTPAIGLGEPYHRRLVETGLTFEVLQTPDRH